MTKIKICGLKRLKDIGYVNEAKPDYAGFVLHFSRSHRSLSEEEATALRARLLPEIPAVGVFVDQPMEIVVSLLKRGVIDIAQLHGSESPDYIRTLRRQTGKTVWKCFQIHSSTDVAEAAESPADCLVLDNGRGTGRSFDWTLLEGFSRPYFLAGGLTPENLDMAIKALHPWGVDLSSGVESAQHKDRDKILAAVAAVRANQ